MNYTGNSSLNKNDRRIFANDLPGFFLKGKNYHSFIDFLKAKNQGFNFQTFLFGLLSRITVVFSVVEELLPRISAIIIINKTIPPTTHTQGCVYQVVVVVVVVRVELELELVLSWAHDIVCTKHSVRNVRKVLNLP